MKSPFVPSTSQHLWKGCRARVPEVDVKPDAEEYVTAVDVLGRLYEGVAQLIEDQRVPVRVSQRLHMFYKYVHLIHKQVNTNLRTFEHVVDAGNRWTCD